MDSRDYSSIPLDYGTFVKVGILTFIVPVVMFLPVFLLSIVLMVAGVLWIVWGSWIVYLSVKSKGWPMIQGVVVENQVGRIEVPSVPGWRLDSFPIIAYRYSVNGVEYLSQKIVLFSRDLQICDDPAKRPPYKDTEELCAKYPVNSIVDVHYNPRSPRDAVLIVGALSRSKQHSIVFFVLGAFLILLGGFLFYVEVW